MYPIHVRHVGWGPSAEMQRFQDDMNQLFLDFTGRAVPETFPPVNLWVGEGRTVVTAKIPGIAPDELEVTVREDNLSLAGESKKPTTAQGALWHRYERTYGRFMRTIQLPFRVDVDKVKARFRDGVLEVELQQLEADKPRRIAIAVR